MTSTSTRDRIQNWAVWSRGGASCSTASMTGIVCDRMRSAALGNVWSGHGAGPTLDTIDAQVVELAWKSLVPKSKELLRWYYIRNATPAFICRRLRIPHRPASVFDVELARSEAEIALVLAELAVRAPAAAASTGAPTRRRVG